MEEKRVAPTNPGVHGKRLFRQHWCVWLRFIKVLMSALHVLFCRHNGLRLQMVLRRALKCVLCVRRTVCWLWTTPRRHWQPTHQPSCDVRPCQHPWNSERTRCLCLSGPTRDRCGKQWCRKRSCLATGETLPAGSVDIRCCSHKWERLWSSGWWRLLSRFVLVKVICMLELWSVLTDVVIKRCKKSCIRYVELTQAKQQTYVTWF